MLKSLFKLILNHKFAFAVLIILISAGTYYVTKANNNTAVTRYLLSAAAKETLITSVSGSGQVSSFRQIEVKPKAAGEITSLSAENSQEVKTGSKLANIDSTDAARAVRDAQINLESANLALLKLKEPADPSAVLQAQNALLQAKEAKKSSESSGALAILQAENALSQAQEAKLNAENDLKKAYEDGYNTVANAFLDLPGIMTGLDDILLGYSYNEGQANKDYYYDQANRLDESAYKYRDNASATYQTARDSYDNSFDDYKASSRFSDETAIESLINETYDTTKNIAEAVKSMNNFIQFYEDLLSRRSFMIPTLADTQLATLNTYTGQTNSHLLSLFNIKQTIQTSKDAIVNADRALDEKTRSLAEAKQKSKNDIINAGRTIIEKTNALADLKKDVDPLDLRSQQITIRQREFALSDAESKLGDYVVTAPFDGVIAKVNFKQNDLVSTGDSIVTLITKQRTANISLNEIDAAKIIVGQKATLTFDAVEGLEITGEVSQVDMIGTVSQGVVTYNVEIVFDTQDDRIKPGMSVSAAIITDVKMDVLAVPGGAVKTSGDVSYVETLNGVTTPTMGSQGITSLTPPIQKEVQVGISNDTSTEITSGLNEGDLVITRTISPTASTATQSAPSLFGGGGGGGGFRPGG